MPESAGLWTGQQAADSTTQTVKGTVLSFPPWGPWMVEGRDAGGPGRLAGTNPWGIVGSTPTSRGRRLSLVLLLLLVWDPCPEHSLLLLLHGGAWTSSRHMGSLAGYGCEVRNVCGLRQEIPSPPSRTPQGPLALRVSPRGTAVTRWTLHAPPCCPRRRPGQSLSWAPPFPAAVKSRAAA